MRCSSGTSLDSRLPPVSLSVANSGSFRVGERLPIGQELLEAGGGEWMLDELREHVVGHGPDVGTKACGLDHVNGMPQRRGKDLGRDALHLVDLADVPEQAEAVGADVVETAEER